MKNLSVLFIFSFLYILFFAGCNSYSSKVSLVEAVEMDNVKLVKYLIKQGHSALTFDEKTHKFPFEAACIRGNPTIMKIFITKASNSIPPSFLRTCIDIAGREGHNKVLELLLQEGNRRKLSLDDSINVALQKAASIGHSSVVKLLLDSGTTGETSTKTAWKAANINGNKEIIQLLLDSNKISLQQKESALLSAVLESYDEIIKLLLDNGVDINTPTKEKQPLSIACEENKIHIAKILIQSGADTNLKNGEGKTPLQIARENGFSEIEQLLLQAGAK